MAKNVEKCDQNVNYRVARLRNWRKYTGKMLKNIFTRLRTMVKNVEKCDQNVNYRIARLRKLLKEINQNVQLKKKSK
jgi:hypothetical protein